MASKNISARKKDIMQKFNLARRVSSNHIKDSQKQLILSLNSSEDRYEGSFLEQAERHIDAAIKVINKLKEEMYN